MKTTFRSLIAVAAMALASTFSACAETIEVAAARVVRVYRRVRDLCFSVGKWLIAKIPKPLNTWLLAWHRVLAGADAAPVQRTAKRRPLLSTRWRMCPST